MGILDFLKGAKSAASFEEAIPQIEASLAEAEREVKALQSKREAAIFEGGEAELAKLQRDIASAKERAETFAIALDGARRRQAEAAARESMAALESDVKAAAKVDARRRQRRKELHQAFTAAADALADIEADDKLIAAINAKVQAAGRSDLTFPNIEGEITDSRQAAFEAYYRDRGESLPSNSRVAPTYPPYHGVEIPNYWPRSRYVVNPEKPSTRPPLAFLD